MLMVAGTVFEILEYAYLLLEPQISFSFDFYFSLVLPKHLEITKVFHCKGYSLVNDLYRLYRGQLHAPASINFGIYCAETLPPSQF